jgi:5-bromo-4-chloroindolyl phosphate hydrolysis protein
MNYLYTSMKIMILIGILFLSISACIESPTVYLCNSNNGKKYHLKSSCRGLSNCQHYVVKTTLDKAKKQGKTLCAFEK